MWNNLRVVYRWGSLTIQKVEDKLLKLVCLPFACKTKNFDSNSPSSFYVIPSYSQVSQWNQTEHFLSVVSYTCNCVGSVSKAEAEGKADQSRDSSYIQFCIALGAKLLLPVFSRHFVLFFILQWKFGINLLFDNCVLLHFHHFKLNLHSTLPKNQVMAPESQ